MLIQKLGVISSGLVWGWYIVLVSRNNGNPNMSFLFIYGLITIAFAGSLLFLFDNYLISILFFISFIFSVASHFFFLIYIKSK